MVWPCGRIGQTTARDLWPSILYIRDAVVVYFGVFEFSSSAVFGDLCQSMRIIMITYFALVTNRLHW